MGWTSHCDAQPYTGWIMGYSETTLQQTQILKRDAQRLRRVDLDERRRIGRR